MKEDMPRIAQIYRGICILISYPGCDMTAEHDEIWFGPSEDIVNEVDKKKLTSMGWTYEDGCGWHRFV